MGGLLDSEKQRQLYDIAKNSPDLSECLSIYGTTYDVDGYWLIEWCIKNAREDLIYSTKTIEEIEYVRGNIDGRV